VERAGPAPTADGRRGGAARSKERVDRLRPAMYAINRRFKIRAAGRGLGRGAALADARRSAGWLRRLKHRTPSLTAGCLFSTPWL